MLSYVNPKQILSIQVAGVAISATVSALNRKLTRIEYNDLVYSFLSSFNIGVSLFRTRSAKTSDSANIGHLLVEIDYQFASKLSHIFTQNILSIFVHSAFAIVLRSALLFSVHSVRHFVFSFRLLRLRSVQKYSRLRCLLRVKGLVICFYLGWSGSILQFRQNVIKVESKS